MYRFLAGGALFPHCLEKIHVLPNLNAHCFLASIFRTVLVSSWPPHSSSRLTPGKT